MAGLKELRTRIEAIKSTKKITSAMKMVAAAGLRRAQGAINKSAVYKDSLLLAARRVALDLQYEEKLKGVALNYPKIMTGNGKDENYLLLVISSDKGLCGSYNANVAKAAQARVAELLQQGKNVRLVCVGKKAREIIKHRYAELIVNSYEGMARKGADFYEALDVVMPVLDEFEKGMIDKVEIVSSTFRSAISRETASRQLLPINLTVANDAENLAEPVNQVNNAFYDYEPDKMEMLEALLLMIVKAMMFDAFVQAQASEQGARMASMDNATRNAAEMISKLTLRYNGLRQSAITTELTEIISGAEAI